MKKKFISALLFIAMIIAIIPSAMTTLFAGDPTVPVYAVLTADGLYPADDQGTKKDGAENILDKNTEKKKITNLIVDNTVTTIGIQAFSDCTNLTTVDLSNAKSLKTIGKNAFSDCGLETITLPESITEIGSNAFNGCTSLTTVDFSNATILETIDYYAFKGCTSLTTVTIPASVKTIYQDPFFDCTSLTEIKFDGENAIYSSDDKGILFDKKQITLIQYPAGKTDTSYIIPADVTTIAASAFRRCTSLTTVTIPTNLKTIGDSAFSNCEKLTTLKLGAKPPKVTNNNAFDKCTALNKTLQFIDENGNPLKDLTDAIKAYKDVDDGDLTDDLWYGWQVPIDPTAPVYAVLTSTGLFPADKDGNKAGDTAITNLNEKKKITNLIVADGVTKIGGYEFLNWTSLTTVTLPASLTEIGKSAFRACRSLEAITLPSGLATIGDSAFQTCESLTTVTIPASVATIGTQPFGCCKSLTEIKVEEGNSNYLSIDGVLFNKTILIQYPLGKTETSYTIPVTVTEIGMDAFTECTNLTAVDLSKAKKLTTIGEYAFHGCTSLTTVSLPTSLTTIDDYAFWECTNLATLKLGANPPATVVGNAFENCTALNKTLQFIDENGKLLTGDAFEIAKKNYSTSWYGWKVPTTAPINPDPPTPPTNPDPNPPIPPQQPGYFHPIYNTPAPTYTITFDTMGGTEVKSIKFENITKLSDLEIVAPTKEGYAFGGWYKDSALKERVLSSDMVNSNLTLYVKWLPLTIDSTNKVENTIETEVPKTGDNWFDNIFKTIFAM